VSATPAAQRRLLGILSGPWIAQSVYVVTRLGVPDLLAGGPRTGADLAAAVGADATALGRVLRALVAAGVLRGEGTDTFGLTPVGDLLRADAPGGGREMALMQGDEVYRSFAEIEYTVRTGRPAFEKVYGQPFYGYLEASPEAAAAFHGPMATQPVPSVLSTVDLDGDGLVVDVGGGTGALLAWVLDRAPGRRGVLAELPAAAVLAHAPLQRLGDRVTVVAADFRTTVPPGGDLYLLCRVLHNWLDDECVDLLGRIRAAALPGARVLVVEKLLDRGRPGTLADHLGDLLVLATQPGRDRTAAEYTGLVAAAGLTVAAVRPAGAGSGEGLVEAVVR
jgi:hypothetical protein